MKAATTDHRVTTRIVAGVAVVGLIVHLLTIHRYGYFRDELYYIACARHLDFGYVDLAPLSAFLLRIELILFSSSLFALRIFPALASAVTVALAGMLARELGGRVWAITLACTGMLGSLIFPAIGNFYSPNVYELLFWTGAIYLLCRIVNGAPSRTWIWLGVVARARNPKQALNGLFRRRNRARDFVNAGASSIWTKMDLAHRFDRICHRASKHHLANRTQLAHLGFIARYRAEPKNVALTPWEFFTQQLTFESGNPSAVVRRIDLAACFPRRPARSRHRFHLLIALAEFIVMHGKNYYVAPAYPMLFAAGGAGFERIFALRFRWLKQAIAFLVVVSAVVLAAVVLPIL